jgi:hypothetical protein
MIRTSFLETANQFEPFTALIQGGGSPEQVKEAIVAILAPYVHDHDLLRKLAIPVFANEAVNVARLLSRPEWKSLLDTSFEIRTRAIASDRQRAFDAYRFFEASIREAQKKYGLQIVFELNGKEDLTLEEFAFELFRVIGTIVESVIQPFLKELYCLACVGRGTPVDPRDVQRADLGKVVLMLDEHISDKNFLTPMPWNLRLNQWRNIAQHHSFTVNGEKIVVQPGKSQSSVPLELTREALFQVSKEMVRRLGALKGSRELTTVNYLEELGSSLPAPPRDRNRDATELVAMFATQGFRLVELREQDGFVDARFVDVNPNVTPGVRHIHCSQFIVVLARRFRDLGVRVSYEAGEGEKKWFFQVPKEKIGSVLDAQDPLRALAEAMEAYREE